MWVPTVLQLPSTREPVGRGARRKMSQAVFKVGTLSQRNEARAQYYTQGLRNKRASWNMTRLSYRPYIKTAIQKWPHSRGNEWMSQRGKDPLGFPQRDVSDFLQRPLITSQPCLSWPMEVMQSINYPRNGIRSVFQNAPIYIYHLYVIAFKSDKSLLGRAGDINHTHDDTEAAAFLAPAVSALSLEIPNASPNSCCCNTANNHLVLPPRENNLPPDDCIHRAIQFHVNLSHNAMIRSKFLV